MPRSKNTSTLAFSTTLILAAAIAGVPTTKVHAAVKRQTIQGVIKTGTLDSGIEVSEDESYGFLTDDPVADKIFAVCKMNDLCEIEATVDTTQQWIKSVQRVRNLSDPEAAVSAPDPAEGSRTISDACSDPQVVRLAADALLKVLRQQLALSTIRTGFVNPNQGEPRVALQSIRTSADRTGRKLCNARAVITIPVKDGRPPFTHEGEIAFRPQLTDAGDEVVVTLVN